MNEKLAEKADKICKENELTHKASIIQAIGEEIEDNCSFVDSFLNCKDFNGNEYGTIWINKDIEYIPSQMMEILGNNGMVVKKFKQREIKSNIVEFR